MELTPAITVPLGPIAWAPGPTPLQRLLAHAGAAVGRRVRLSEIEVSPELASELELQTRRFVEMAVPGPARQRLVAMWLRGSYPTVDVTLAPWVVRVLCSRSQVKGRT